MTVDVDGLKARIDLVDLIGRDTVLKRVAGTADGEYAGPCPFCGGHDRLRVQPRRARWWCRHCSPDEHWQDAVGYVRQRDNCSFLEACERLGASLSEMGSRQTLTPVVAEPPVEQLPPPAWQRTARAFVDRASKALWSDNGARARTYLEGRGIKPQTMKDWQLGYQCCDEYESVEEWGVDGKSVWLPRGIVIPWFGFGPDLWSVKIKRPPSSKPSYWAVRGSVPVLFGVDLVLPGEPVILVESELDGILIEQETVGAPVVVAGSARRSLGLRALQALLAASKVFIAYDNDAAGDEAAEQLLRQMPHAVRMRVPREKDPTDFWLAGGDVAKWALAAFKRELGVAA